MDALGSVDTWLEELQLTADTGNGLEDALQRVEDLKTLCCESTRTDEEIGD